MTRDAIENNKGGEIPPTPKVQEAAMWLADRPATQHPIPEIRDRFELTMKQACDACSLAQRFRTLRGAFA